MALPQHSDAPDATRLLGTSLFDGIRTAPRLTGRKPTRTESKRRYRRGHRASAGHTIGHEQYDPWWEETRNGLPWRPYVYRGTGRDAYDGTCAFEEAT